MIIYSYFSGQIVLFLFKSHHFLTYFLCKINYNNISQPFHDSPIPKFWESRSPKLPERLCLCIYALECPYFSLCFVCLFHCLALYVCLSLSSSSCSWNLVCLYMYLRPLQYSFILPYSYFIFLIILSANLFLYFFYISQFLSSLLYHPVCLSIRCLFLRLLLFASMSCPLHVPRSVANPPSLYTIHIIMSIHIFQKASR